MIQGLKSIRRERALLERDRVLMESMLEDELAADMMEYVLEEDENIFEGVTNDQLDALIAKIPESEDEDEQVDRILSAPDDGLDVDGILGIDTEELEEE